MAKETKSDKKTDTVKKESPSEIKVEKAPEAKKVEPAKKINGQAIAIAVLATMLGCIIVVFVALFATGVITFDSNAQNNDTISADNTDQKDEQPDEDEDDDKKGGYYHGGTESGKTSENSIINNYYKQVKEDGTLAKVGDLEFYLPKQFKAGGKNKDGAFTYNLTNDDGWAQVLVYAERSSLTPAKFLSNRVSAYLDITDSAYKMNGTTWVQAENAYALAYATKLDGKVYAVYYSVKLDSDATSKAMQMIPKTLYMKRIYKN